MTASTPAAADVARWQKAEDLVAAGRLDEAVEAYRALRDSEELVVPAALRLAQVAAGRGRLREAVACAHDFSVMRGRNPTAMLELGTLLLAAGFPNDGLQMLERARSAGASGPQLMLSMAHALHETGRDAEARAAYGACLEAAPGLVSAWLGLAEIGGRNTEGERRLAEILAELLERDGNNEAGARLDYALFHLLDRSAGADEAWVALERGMRLQRVALSRYDPAAELAVLEHVAAVRVEAAADADAGAAATSQRDQQLPSPSQDGPAPVFLVGLHAPAIAALGKLLARHPQVADIGEARDFVQQMRWCADAIGAPRLDLDLARRADAIDHAMLGERYRAHTAWRSMGKPVVLDRNPANFANVAHIARALPNARILHLSAAPMDTCFAAMSTWTDPEAPWSHDQAETAEYYRAYRRLMAHWRSEFPSRVLDVRQDELLADPAAVLEEVLRFCGLDVAATPKLAEGAASLLGQGRAAPQRWRRYEEPLAPLKAGLGALAY
jgi:tetratricopeptide (TPR) repeat protein